MVNRTTSSLIASLVLSLNGLLQRPSRVLTICISLGLAGVILDGTAIRLWSLYREHSLLGQRIGQTEVRVKQLEKQIQDSQRPQFIERAARDQFDFVQDGDLVFVFSDDDALIPENSSKSAL